MIASLEGKVVLKRDKFVILEVAGVGYKVFLSQKTLNKISQLGRTLKVFCYLNVKQNGLDLYGFLDDGELELFELIEGIPGVGPKAALEISALGSLEKIKKEILTHNEQIFEKIPGIGRKKAQTIILELSGKIREMGKEKIKEKETSDEAIEALINLGFSRQRVKEVLSQIPKDIEDTEQRIKEALKTLGKK